jgi:siroheme synthase
MGVAQLGEICAGLIARGLAADTPAAIVVRAAMPGGGVIRGNVATLPALAVEAGVEPPALTVIGAVAGLDLNAPDPASTTS